MKDKFKLIWDKAKGWVWLAIKVNIPKYAAYLLALTGVFIYNLGHDVDIPIPVPPIPFVPDWPQDPENGPGWVPPTKQDVAAAKAWCTDPHFQDSDAGIWGADGDDVPLYRAIKKASGMDFPAFNQGQIGSCVSFGVSLAVEASLAVDIAEARGPPKEWVWTVREAVYGGSRVEANGGRVPFGGDGSTGAWAVKWLQKIGGALPAKKYDSLDLTTYDLNRCRQWGNSGVPDDLEKYCRENPVTFSQVRTGVDVRRSLNNGYAVFICSNVGFGNLSGQLQRDGDGFLRPSGQWNHCMAVLGYQGGARPGFLIVNSWGANWVNGPKGKFDDIPPGSFWCDAGVMDRICSQEDSWAVAGIKGFRARKIRPDDWLIKRNIFGPAFAMGF